MKEQSHSIKTAISPSLFFTSGISVNVQDLAPSCAGLLFGKDSCGVSVVLERWCVREQGDKVVSIKVGGGVALCNISSVFVASASFCDTPAIAGGR